MRGNIRLAGHIICTFDDPNLARETQIKVGIGPQMKIVARFCSRLSLGTSKLSLFCFLVGLIFLKVLIAPLQLHFIIFIFNCHIKHWQSVVFYSIAVRHWYEVGYGQFFCRIAFLGPRHSRHFHTQYCGIAIKILR